MDRSRTSACNTRIVNPRQVDSCSDSRNAKPNRVTRGEGKVAREERETVPWSRLSDSSEKHLALRARDHLTNARSSMRRIYIIRRKEKFSKFFYRQKKVEEMKVTRKGRIIEKSSKC